MSVGIIAGNCAAISIVSVAVDLGSVAANTSEEETATVPGVKTTDFVVCMDSALSAGQVVANARVSSSDTVTLQVINTTAGAIDAASRTMTFLVIRPEGLSAASRVLT